MLHCKRTARRGFSLVEMLVVVGIITVLIAMLLPALVAMREHAKQTNCLSNLRQLGIAYQLYASNYDDQIPLGYINNGGNNNEIWTGYMIYDGANYPLMGAMYKARLLANPQAFYCPSQIDARWQFATPQNPWPPPVPGTLIRVGYTSRPTVAWSNGVPVTPMSRRANFGNLAILADIVGIPADSPDYTNVHHQSLNVLYGDGSAHSVDKASYNAIQLQIEGYNSTGSNPPPPLLYLNTANPNAVALWNEFDHG